MKHLEVVWTPGRDGNIRHIAEHGISTQEVEEVLSEPIAVERSRRSGLPIAFGFTRRGRKLAVVYKKIDRITVYPITAYEVED